jgi:hypothetical protein
MPLSRTVALTERHLRTPVQSAHEGGWEGGDIATLTPDYLPCRTLPTTSICNDGS